MLNFSEAPCDPARAISTISRGTGIWLPYPRYIWLYRALDLQADLRLILTPFLPGVTPTVILTCASPIVNGDRPAAAAVLRPYGLRRTASSSGGLFFWFM